MLKHTSAKRNDSVVCRQEWLEVTADACLRSSFLSEFRAPRDTRITLADMSGRRMTHIVTQFT
jgi:hypothetical protein